MGCASSKNKVCQNCHAPYIPVRRSQSMHHVRHPPQTPGDSYHLVALTSSTLGSLKLDPPSIHNRVFKDHNNGDKVPLIENHEEDDSFFDEKTEKQEFEMGMIEAKTWSNMINEKIPKFIPKTPIRTPPGEPETINAWELMEGLDDVNPLSPVNHFRSFSFHVASRHSHLHSINEEQSQKVKENGDDVSLKPLWLDLADSDTKVPEFDPKVIATFKKELEILPPENPFRLKSLDNVKKPKLEKLIVYFTSLRGVRKTYEDCCHVRVVLKGLGVKVDERDVSMDSRFKEELKELLGDGFGKGGLPKVFLGKSYIGGADEIRRLNEDGKLEKLVESCEALDDGRGGNGNCEVCEACGDLRFVPCETCSGSCKIYYDEEEEEEEQEENEYGFRRCPDCNENGLIRCPICCD